MEKFEEKLQELRLKLSDGQQRLLSLNSIENYLIYFNDINRFKLEVQALLDDYFSSIEKIGYSADKNIGRTLGSDYIMKIGVYYRVELGFKFYRPISAALFWGIQIDIILSILGYLKKIYFFPIGTCLLILNWMFVKIFYEKKHKVFGIMY